MLRKNLRLVLAFTLIIIFANFGMAAVDLIEDITRFRTAYVMNQAEMTELLLLKEELRTARRPFLIINVALKEAAREGHQKIMEWILLDSLIKPSQDSINWVFENAAREDQKELMSWMLDLPEGRGPDKHGLSAAYYEGYAGRYCLIM